MKWTIPGTVLQVSPEEADHIPEQLSSMFLAGGILLSQVCAITGLEPYIVQNWIKRGFLTAPQKKRYTLDQLCRIVTINMLRPAMTLEQICSLLQHVNGALDDNSDDIIDDSRLYFLFVLVAMYHRQRNGAPPQEKYLEKVLADYQEPVPGARDRVEKVLRIMLTAWAASQMRLAAEKMVSELTINKKENCQNGN